ncbi:hypothetical protein [Kitasatospora phosalacinea]|uniref:hypothetical protein n=1 Tax=Kitasatospora phosalacinea TaxID=2065 RepID=UPI0012FED1B6|nr:hypothetical protein [Kitasatospora phosalacinea]
MEIESTLCEIRKISVPDISRWIQDRLPDGASPQWWLAIFESLETSVSPVRGANPPQVRRDFEIGVEVVTLAVTSGGVRPAVGAYWMLRLAAIALRFNPPLGGLPALLSPDEAASWALSRMPLSHGQVIEESESRKAAYLAAGDDFYAPVGQEFSVNHEARAGFPELQDVELVLSALPWISSATKRADVKQSIDAWMNIRGIL